MPTKTDEYGKRYLSCDKCGYGADKLYDFGDPCGELCYECGIAQILTDNPKFEVWDAEFELENHYEIITEDSVNDT